MRGEEGVESPRDGMTEGSRREVAIWLRADGCEVVQRAKGGLCRAVSNY